MSGPVGGRWPRVLAGAWLALVWALVVYLVCNALRPSRPAPVVTPEGAAEAEAAEAARWRALRDAG